MKQELATIQGKLMRLVLVVSVVVLFLTSAGFFIYDLYTYKEANRERLFTLGKIIAYNSTAALAFDNAEEARVLLQALKADKHIIAAGLYDINGNVFAKYPASLPGYMLPLHPLKDGLVYTQGHLEGFVPAYERDRRMGTLYLQSDMNAFYRRFQQYILIAVLVIAVSIFVAYLSTQQLQKKISEPILNLVTTAGKISKQHDYTVRAQKFDNDELGILTDAFNQMLTQIEKQNAEITSFNHELELKVIERTNELEKVNTELKLKSDFEESVINSSIDVIAVFDKDFKYVILNKYGQEVFGVTEKNVIGKNILEVFPQVETSVMYHTLQQAFQKGEILHTGRYRSHISDRVMENFFIPLMDKENKVYRVLVVGHDITEINEANEKLKHLNQELEKSNLDLEQFAFVASHDLQEPLRKIQTFSQMLEQKLEDKIAAKKYLEKIITSAERMSDLIKAVLNYSRLSGEKGQVERADLNEILENIKNDFELIIAEKGAIIKHDTLPVIYGNPLQLNQLLLNLISNSLKFSKEKPVVTITSNTIESEPSNLSEPITNNQIVELVFKDNGIGFEQRFADKIFTVFQRLHGKQEYAGTGIGLALCKKIIDNHNGNISVKSNPGEGTTFTILLPVNLPVTESALLLS